jgi:hypothetical protein
MSTTEIDYGFTRAALVPVAHHGHRGLINQGATCYRQWETHRLSRERMMSARC